MSPNDKNALVSRSKCYLLLGQPRLALKDAEVALNEDSTYLKGNFENVFCTPTKIKCIHCKLYLLGISYSSGITKGEDSGSGPLPMSRKKIILSLVIYQSIKKIYFLYALCKVWVENFKQKSHTVTFR